MTTHEVTHPSKRRCFTEGCTNEPGGKWFCPACEARIHEASVRETARQAERKAGAMLAKMEKHPPGPDKEDRSHDVTDLHPSLDDLGVTKMQSHRWQREATARQLAQQARARGLPLCVAADSPDIPVGPPDAADAAVGDVATPPPALGSSGASTRAIQHPSPRFAKKVGS